MASAEPSSVPSVLNQHSEHRSAALQACPPLGWFPLALTRHRRSPRRSGEDPTRPYLAWKPADGALDVLASRPACALGV